MNENKGTKNHDYSCDIIKDLIPSYIDGLSSDDTNALVKQHLKTCQSCKEYYESMSNEDLNPETEDKENIEIDFMKKSKTKVKRIILAILLVAVFLIIGTAIIYPYFDNQEFSYEQMSMDLNVSDVEVDGKNIENGILFLNLRVYGNLGVRNVTYDEDAGVVQIKVSGAKASRFAPSYYETAFRSKTSIKKIMIGENTIWENGTYISEDTVNIYKTKHPYIGDNSKNGETLNALCMYRMLGQFTIELQTNKEPYGLMINMSDSISSETEERLSHHMKYYAYMCMALIDNLSYVTFNYEIDGEKVSKSFNLEDGKAELGKSLKEYGQSEYMLELLAQNAY